MSTSTTTLHSASLYSADISERIAARRAAYGGSDSTKASFNRPQYVQYNSLSQSKDFGTLDNLYAEISGALGGQGGTQTLFFKVNLRGPADIRINKIPINPREDQYISVGVQGPDGKPLPLDENGFVTATDIVGTDNDESADAIAPGVYVFTVSSSQWQPIPYSAVLQVIRYKELNGSAAGELYLLGRLAMARLTGAALLADESFGVIARSDRINLLVGVASGGDASDGRLTIPSGTISGAMDLVGRIRPNWRLLGSTDAQLVVSGSLSVSRSSGGGGY